MYTSKNTGACDMCSELCTVPDGLIKSEEIKKYKVNCTMR